MINLEELLGTIAINIKKRGLVNCEFEKSVKHLNLGISDYTYNLDIEFFAENKGKIKFTFITWDETEVEVSDISLNEDDLFETQITSYRFFDLNETEFMSKVSSSLDNIYYIQKHYSELVKINYQNRRKQEIEKDFTNGTVWSSIYT